MHSQDRNLYTCIYIKYVWAPKNGFKEMEKVEKVYQKVGMKQKELIP